MSFKTEINLNNEHVKQFDNEILSLSGDTVIANSGTLVYESHPNFTGNTQIVDKKYVDDLIINFTGVSTIYTLDSPSTITVGGLTSGSVLTGKTSNEILRDILVPYLSPTFTSFSNNITSPVEVGCQISGTKRFTWGFNNSSNVQSNTMCIVDVTASNNLATNISTTSPYDVTITTKTFSSCGETQVWSGSAKNSKDNQFNSTQYNVVSYLPYFWGKCTCPGEPGSNRPVGNANMISGGTKIVANSSSSISITFSSSSNDYLWFAIPSSVVNKTTWCFSALNNGSIGGSVSPGGNLFPSPDLIANVNSVCWNNQTYCIYISNYQTATSGSMSIS